MGWGLRAVAGIVALGVVGAAGAMGCSSGSSSSATSPTSTVTADGGPTSVCNGARLTFHVAGGGPVQAGSQLLSENGFSYLIVDGDCHYWTLADDESDVHTGLLSPEMVDAMNVALRLKDWAAVVQTDASGGCEDGSGDYVDFATLGTVSVSSCIANDPTAPLGWLGPAIQSQITATYAAGQPINGPVRYVLVAEPDKSSWSADVLARSFAWPLADVSAAGAAISYGHATNYTPGSGTLATGSSADALRSLRAKSDDAGTPMMTGGYVPITDSAGNHYDLYVRDSIPLENDAGLVTDW